MTTRPQPVSIADAFHSKADRLGLILDAGSTGLSRSIEPQSALESHIDFVNYLSLDQPTSIQIIDPQAHPRILEPDDVLARRMRQLFEDGEILMVVFSDGFKPRASWYSKPACTGSSCRSAMSAY